MAVISAERLSTSSLPPPKRGAQGRSAGAAWGRRRGKERPEGAANSLTPDQFCLLPRRRSIGSALCRSPIAFAYWATRLPNPTPYFLAPAGSVVTALRSRGCGRPGGAREGPAGLGSRCRRARAAVPGGWVVRAAPWAGGRLCHTCWPKTGNYFPNYQSFCF